MKMRWIGFFSGILIVCLLFILCGLPAFAVTAQDYSVSGRDYVLPDDSRYDYSNLSPVKSFFYGANSLGKLQINGAIEKDTKYNGYSAYGATGDLILQYAYDGAYQKSDEESWHIVEDGMHRIREDNDFGPFAIVGNGCIMVEKSYDGIIWKRAIDTVRNYFTKEKTLSESQVYKIQESEYKNGMYYRVVVGYRFGKRTHDGFLWSDDYDYRKCAEVYEFYVASEKNYITFRDMGNDTYLRDQASTDTGFMICMNGSQATVTVNSNNDKCQDFDYFAEPGKYSINITTILGKKYNYTVTVAKGSTFTPLEPKTYMSEKDKGFPLDKPVTRPVFGSHLTSLSIVTPKGVNIKQDNSRYGIKGKSVSLFLKLTHGNDILENGWVLSADSWGGGKNQLVCGVGPIGEVGKGALIVQTSKDGKNWTNDDKGRYAKGIPTTDYASNFGKAENVLIYTPDGGDVKSGIHIRVLFAYQVYQADKKEYRDYTEVYQFYLCYDDLGAVTFHNLSIQETLDETFKDEDQNTVEVYKQAETLVDGSYTTTGFQIDKRGNPAVKHNVLLNEKSVSSTQRSFEETGRYDITLTSVVGSTRKLTIYVDRLAPEEAMKLYFGEGFITGKRIYAEGDYPVYEGGECSYHVATLDDTVLPLYGQITNVFTGSVITIEQSLEEKTGILSEPGEYQAIFATSEKYFSGELAGDARVFTFHFRVIPQGTAPGPVVNKQKLEEYSHTTISDCNPVYYGLTFSSAGKGNITHAFATQEDAKEYAYNYEKGTVELQKDGTYRYTGSFIVRQKTKFDSNWDLTDAMYYFAGEAVEKHYFNMSDEYTYLTLSPEVLEAHPNLRQIELEQSVKILTEGQKEKLSDIEALPLLNDKRFAYFDPETGEVNEGESSFEFVTDRYGGLDSQHVTITDSKGDLHDIAYSQSVGKQLQQNGCPSGIVTIREETKYGDACEYQAVYIAPEENQTELTLSLKRGEENDAVVFQGSNEGPDIEADSFAIAGLQDPLDPYALLIVKHRQHETFYTAKDEIDAVWSEPGHYDVTCVNRMGYGYTVGINLGGVNEAADDSSFRPEDVAIPDYPPTAVNDDTTKEQPTQLPAQNKDDASASVSDSPVETERQGNSSGSNSSWLIIVGAIAALGLIISVLAYRIRLFSRARKEIKREEGKRHD